MTLAADILVLVAVGGGSGAIGYAIGRSRGPRLLNGWQNVEPGRAGWQKPTAPPDPADRPTGLPPVTQNGHREDTYGIAQVQGLYCIKPSCRIDHPDPDIVLVGIGLAGSAYQCRHCLTTW